MEKAAQTILRGLRHCVVTDPRAWRWKRPVGRPHFMYQSTGLSAVQQFGKGTTSVVPQKVEKQGALGPEVGRAGRNPS